MGIIATTRLTPRRRSVLYLRAAGWSYSQIAQRLKVSIKVVRNDLLQINKTLIPGLTDGDEPAKGYRLIYALGLLDAGVEPEEVRYHMNALIDRSDWLLGIEKGRMVPVSNLADIDNDGSM